MDFLRRVPHAEAGFLEDLSHAGDRCFERPQLYLNTEVVVKRSFSVF